MAVARWLMLLTLVPLVACAQAVPPPGGELPAATDTDGADVIEAARLIDDAKCTDEQGLARIDALLKKAITEASPKVNVRAHIERARYAFIAGSSCTLYASDEALMSARMDLKLALSAKPDSAAALIQLARVDTQMGRIDSALDELKKAEAQGTRDAQLYVHRALAYMVKKNLSAAEEALRKVPACRVDHAQPDLCGGRIGAQTKIDLAIAMNDRPAILRAYREGIEAFPTSAFMHGNLAKYLLHYVGDVDGAIAEIDKAMAIRPYQDMQVNQAIAQYAKWAQLRKTDPAAATQFRQQAEAVLSVDELLPQIACGIGGNPTTQGLATALIAEGKSIDAHEADEHTGLMKAASCGQAADLKWLLSHNASPQLTNRGGFTAFTLATYYGRLENVEALLPASDINAADVDGNTPLQLAAYQNHTDVALRLIKAKADINRVNSNGDTALIYAAQRGNEILVRALLKAGADIKSRSKHDPKDAAQWAEGMGRKDLAELIRSFQR